MNKEGGKVQQSDKQEKTLTKTAAFLSALRLASYLHLGLIGKAIGSIKHYVYTHEFI